MTVVSLMSLLIYSCKVMSNPKTALSLVLLWVAVQASPSRIRRPLDGAIPPQEPPPELVELYTMNGKIPLKVNQATYIREDFNVFGFREEFSHLTIDREIKSMKWAGALRRDITSRVVSESLTLQALTKAGGIQGRTAVVYGSRQPTLEAFLLANGASEVYVVDYNPPLYDHPHISCFTVDEFLERQVDAGTRLQPDVAFAISAFEHDGLGRYGDPIAPDGDLLAMEMVRQQLNPNGHFILSVLAGPDAVIWNSHRRYGNVRLPLLLQGWEVIERFNWSPGNLEKDVVPDGYIYRPVFLLKPSLTTPEDQPVLSTASGFGAAAREEQRSDTSAPRATPVARKTEEETRRTEEETWKAEPDRKAEEARKAQEETRRAEAARKVEEEAREAKEAQEAKEAREAEEEARKAEEARETEKARAQQVEQVRKVADDAKDNAKGHRHSAESWNAWYRDGSPFQAAVVVASVILVWSLAAGFERR